MTKENYNKKEIKQEARKLLKEGASKQEAYETLKEKYKYSVVVSKILHYIPSQKAIKKYSKWNYVLLVLLLIQAGTFMWFEPSVLVLIYYGLLIYAVLSMLVKHYVWVSVLSFVALISFLAFIITDEALKIQWPELLLILTYIPTLILPLWLDKKLCPKPMESKTTFTDSQGQQRVRVVHQFNE